MCTFPIKDTNITINKTIYISDFYRDYNFIVPESTKIKFKENGKLIIEANQKHITENINYAEKIQQTLLPEKKLMEGFFSDFFVSQ